MGNVSEEYFRLICKLGELEHMILSLEKELNKLRDEKEKTNNLITEWIEQNEKQEN